MNPEEYPTPWQRKALWSALTSLAVVTIGAVAVGLIWLCSRVLGFLQPILIPFAAAGVIAYLLEPVVSKLVKWGSSRLLAVIFVFSTASMAFVGLTIWVAPVMWTQSVNLVQRVPRYAASVQRSVVAFSENIHKRYGVTVLPANVPPQPDNASPSVTPPPLPTPTIPGETPEPPKAPALPEAAFDWGGLFSGDWLQSLLQDSGKHLLTLTRNSLGGFLGVVGFLLSLIIVPIYLFYFLLEAPTIARTWSDYLPLRASAFKDEVVSALNEINGYLIAFFRGQLVVSIINGLVTGVGLAIVRLEYGLLIGVLLCFLGIVPYFGIWTCWLISVILASIQSGGTWVPTEPAWLFPIVVSGIFFVVHWFDGLFVTPRIVGESVGLHPITVIFSILVWSLLMGGLLGALLAVPMTATIKVLMRRYVWERRFKGPGGGAITREAPELIPSPASAAEPLPAQPITAA